MSQLPVLRKATVSQALRMLETIADLLKEATMVVLASDL